MRYIPESKRILSKQIQLDTSAFLNSGGKIEAIKAGIGKETPSGFSLESRKAEYREKQGRSIQSSPINGMLTTLQLSMKLGVSQYFVYLWRKREASYPKTKKIGNKIYHNYSEVYSWAKDGGYLKDALSRSRNYGN